MKVCNYLFYKDLQGDNKILLIRKYPDEVLSVTLNKARKQSSMDLNRSLTKKKSAN